MCHATFSFTVRSGVALVAKLTSGLKTIQARHLDTEQDHREVLALQEP